MSLLRSTTFFVLLLAALPAWANIGSPDAYLQTQTGPYTVLLSIHPPAAYPGAMEVDLRAGQVTTAAAALDGARPQPLRNLDGNFTTTLWPSSPDAHPLHLIIDGQQGIANLDITLPAADAPIATAAIAHSKWVVPLALILPLLALYLFREAIANSARRRQYRILGGTLLAITLLLLIYSARSRTSAPPPTRLDATLSPTGLLDLTLTNPTRGFADILPDHGKLMHLFLIRQPQLDVIAHLLPVQLAAGHFRAQLPAMPSGSYTVYADVYHANGLEETATLNLGISGQSGGKPFDPDDSLGTVAPLSTAEAPYPTPAPAAQDSVERLAHLPDGYSMRLTTPAHMKPRIGQLLNITLLDPTGNPPTDSDPYLGTLAHAIVLRPDGTVFTEVHPGGTLPTPGPANPSSNTSTSATIPYGFPTPGLYRLFVQMKHGAVVETAAFDLNISN